MVFARLDEPACIAILTRTPPCLLCADADLLTSSQRRSNNAGFVTMVAATEAFKLLASAASIPDPTLLQFSGFGCTTQPLRQRRLEQCACSAARETR
jgi:hypothetical protein